MALTRLSSKGQVVIPLEVRSHLGWKKGARINVQETPFGVFLVEVAERPLEHMRGLFKGLGIRKADVKRWRQEDELHDRSEFRTA